MILTTLRRRKMTKKRLNHLHLAAQSIIVKRQLCQKSPLMVQFKSQVTLARINQIKLNNYAKKDIHGQRSFQKSWYRGRDWLEYSVEAGAAFCFPCRKYLCNPSDEFGQTGFRNWKNALAAKKGLLKHESSKAHLNSITIWHDKNHNINKGTEITKIIQELPFRGTGSTNITDAAKDESIIYSSGLFIAMFSYTIQKDPELNKIMKLIPQNAQYTSPQIQNETPPKEAIIGMGLTFNLFGFQL
ncbi:uncharacterized protein LOC135929708 [Gordionus sp. m RMFG-2023]|uniref:uncharacterized protein LOC135929708 n=1 Tax=Gordionus sp. m RMFG-2023 TaxID=3053472 RepID=UPI0031FDEED0